MELAQELVDAQYTTTVVEALAAIECCRAVGFNTPFAIY
jgi:hypothetical protein